MRWLIWASLLATTPALAQLKYTPKTVGGVTIAVPEGWSVSTSNTPVPTITIEERPGAKDAPSIVIMRVPAAPARVGRALVQAAMPRSRLIGYHEGPTGGMSEYHGPIHGIPAKMVFVHRAHPPGALVAAFAAPIARYDALGGAQVLATVLSGAPGPTTPAVPITIPPAYAQSKTPVLHWLIEDFERIPPAQVAAALKQINHTEAQLLGVYSAFANLVHYRACLADAQSRLPTGATCAHTAAGWRQTLQFTNGDVGQAIQEALRQRGTLQVSARCGDGRNDAASCTAWRKTMSNVSRMQHESMMRVITNLGGNNCIVGDPGCVPY